jgi:hypothetical protein
MARVAKKVEAVQEEIGNGVFELIRVPWRWDNLTGLESSLAPKLLRGKEISAPIKESEDALIKAMTHPVVQGIYKIDTNPHPYGIDAPLKERARRLKSEIKPLLQAAGCSVKRQRWATLLISDDGLARKYLDYLLPTFEMSTLRTAQVIEFSRLFNAVANKDEESEHIKGVGLLVITRVNPKVENYNFLSGHLASELYARGDASTPTLFVEKVPTSVLKRSNTVDSALADYFLSKGFNRSDPVMDMLLGNETHVFSLGMNQHSFLTYRVIGDSDGGW